MNDIAKYLAVNFNNQRDQDQYVIDHADYYTCVYKTTKRDISATFTSLKDARMAAIFASKVQYKAGKTNPKHSIKVRAWVKTSNGADISALVEEIMA